MHHLEHKLAASNILQTQSLQSLPFLHSLNKLTTDFLPKEVQVWQVELTTDYDRDLQDQEKLHQLLLPLNSEERDRCLRYRRPAERIRYAVLRIVLRHLLAQQLRLPSSLIRITTGLFGKPYLANTDLSLQFNISHSQHIGLIALSSQRAVGIDIEAIYPLVDKRFLLKEILSVEEQQYCQNSDDSAFFKCWTGKEAVVKALGTGIQQALPSISMLPADEFTYTLSLESPIQGLKAWQLPTTNGYCAALALL